MFLMGWGPQKLEQGTALGVLYQKQKSPASPVPAQLPVTCLQSTWHSLGIPASKVQGKRLLKELSSKKE